MEANAALPRNISEKLFINEYWLYHHYERIHELLCVCVCEYDLCVCVAREKYIELLLLLFIFTTNID